jgi:Streptomyces sporulation and cell division protein, SsgA
MIGAAIRTKTRARPVGGGGQLAYGGYWYLEYEQGQPYEVRLVQPGPYPVELTFARDILRSALRGEPDGQGEVRARLEFVQAARRSMVLIAVDLPDFQGVLALDDRAVAAFLGATKDLVPFGEESRFLDPDAWIAAILGDAA